MILKHAFKEWAVICAALAQGRQALILRKGGIAEERGEFAVEHPRFWLFPTYTHQQADGITEEARPLLQEVEKQRPANDVVRLSHWAEVTGIYHVRQELPALMLGHLHVWSAETVRQRFAYRTPGLYVLSVRVYQAPQTYEVRDTPAYQGCKSWVELDEELSTDGSTPVLDDAAYRDLQHSLDLLLNPTALA
jgi:hypothetical protein